MLVFFFQLITPPVNTRALAILSAVAGDALTRHLNRILPAMLKAIQDCFGTEHEKEVSSKCLCNFSPLFGCDYMKLPHF